jgi:hypothetical protein
MDSFAYQRIAFTATMSGAEEMQHIAFEDSTGIRLPTHHNTRPSAFANKLTRHAKVVAKLCYVHQVPRLERKCRVVP